MKPLVQACLILGLILFSLVLLTAAYGYSQYQARGAIAAVVAGLVCGVPALAALVVTVWFAGGPLALGGTLAGTGLRTGGPLLGLLLVRGLAPELENAGFVTMVLILYLVVLLVETVLAVRLSKPKLASSA